MRKNVYGSNWTNHENRILRNRLLRIFLKNNPKGRRNLGTSIKSLMINEAGTSKKWPSPKKLREDEWGFLSPRNDMPEIYESLKSFTKDTQVLVPTSTRISSLNTWRQASNFNGFRLMKWNRLYFFVLCIILHYNMYYFHFTLQEPC